MESCLNRPPVLGEWLKLISGLLSAKLGLLTFLCCMNLGDASFCKSRVCFVGTSQTVSSKHVLIMDEVDGMAGNEDRGGIQVNKIISIPKN